jgi:NADPH:quinone reductase-like Zn-dependent oxidoreductase
LTALTAWEGLFERLNIQDAGADKTLLIIGGAGGVGSLAIPFAKHNSKVKVIATASREDSARWCRDRGADVVVNYRDLKGELAKQGSPLWITFSSSTTPTGTGMRSAT